ncbi:MAG: DUF362 domain-containing protein [Candidatus Geothermarchaeales archaeon]
MTKVVIIRGRNPETMVPMGLDALGARASRTKIVVKPNLISNRPYPITTPAETVEAVITYFKNSGREFIIAEGSGWSKTLEVYRDRGYLEIAGKHGVRLVDLNRDEYEVRRSPNVLTLREFEFPLTLKDSYLISAPVLKRHSITGVTLSLKNMLGATVGGNKGRFHSLGINECIVDINRYKAPDLAVIDGRKSVSSELGGRTREFNLMIFSEDPVAADAVGADTLGFNPLSIKHLKMAHEMGLGVADLRDIEVVELEA